MLWRATKTAARRVTIHGPDVRGFPPGGAPRARAAFVQPYNTLLELCALTCTLDAHDSRNAADTVLARHNPLPFWVAETVLLSSDLAPRLTGAMATRDNVAQRRCAGRGATRGW